LPLVQNEIQFSGHAIEVRLCAEDDHFHPQAGTLMHFAAPHCAEFTAQDVQGPARFDHALESGLQVTSHFDSLLGKLIVHAADREAAIHQLTQALDQIELLGLPSNRSFLRACLNHPVFRDGQARISFLADHADALRASLIDQERALLQVCAIAAIFDFSANTAGLAFPYPRPIRIRHRAQLSEWSAHCPQFRHLPDGQLECQLGSVVHRLRIAHLGKRRWHVQSGGVDCWLEDASFEPSGVSAALLAADLRAPYNGRVGKVAVTVGQTLAAHEPALVLESMKLEHSLSNPVAVQVAEVLVSSGQQVQPGQVLLRFVAPLAGQ
jgi:3-methylcrotonyl-CoA carboxylase alpha subunit/geranyl-CoA carboxylase alpha subunit